MKKTLNINIGGFFFTIEETAFLKLNAYLESLKKYFSTYESCDEIIQDIESRIAEKFFETYQTTNLLEIEDVDKIILSMGSVSDFEALKEDEDLSEFQTPKGAATQTLKPKNLYKDESRKALSGILAGLAHKYDIDVVWIRVLFVALSIGLIPAGIGIALIALYIVGWMILPSYSNLEENTRVRKYYRVSEDKILGGVASGLSKYFKMDLMLMRIILILMIIPAIPLYILIWIFAPVANSVTEQLQLHGQPITIQNIELSVKNQNIETHNPHKSTISRILLFPFTVAGSVIHFLGKLVKPIASILRVFTGLIITLIGASLTLACLLALGAYFGAQEAAEWISMNPSLEATKIIQEFPIIGSIFIFFACLIPSIATLLAGIAIVLGKKIGTKPFWATLLAIWLIGFVGTISVGTTQALKFSKSANDSTVQKFTITEGEILTFDVNKKEIDGYYPKVWLYASDEKEIKVEVRKKSQGANSSEALEYAKRLSFNYEIEKNTLRLDNKYYTPEEDPFRDQSIGIHIYIPKGQKFKFTKQYLEELNYPYHILSSGRDYSGDNIFVIENEEIICTNCPEEDPYIQIDKSEFIHEFDFDKSHLDEQKLLVSAFTDLKIKSPFKVILTHGDSTKIIAYGHNKDAIKITHLANTLEVEFEDPFKEYHEPIYIHITTPKISNVELNNGAMLKMYGFSKMAQFNLKANNNSKAALDLDAGSSKIDAENQSNVVLQGNVKNLHATSKTKSYINVLKADIETLRENKDSNAVIESGEVKNKIDISPKKNLKKI